MKSDKSIRVNSSRRQIWKLHCNMIQTTLRNHTHLINRPQQDIHILSFLDSQPSSSVSSLDSAHCTALSVFQKPHSTIHCFPTRPHTSHTTLVRTPTQPTTTTASSCSSARQSWELTLKICGFHSTPGWWSQTENPKEDEYDSGLILDTALAAATVVVSTRRQPESHN